MKENHPPRWKALIADDMLPMRNLLKMMLRKQGVQDFIMAEDGQEAVNLYNKELEKGGEPDLILLDIDMPRMNGLEALQELRKLNTTIFITMVSANAIQNTVTEAKKLLVNSFLVKPIQPRQIEELVRNFEAYQQSLYRGQ
ncbi:MAG: response regulator [Gammaproteobacteria bacterium]|nr:response regulator [Gammaproteobacteria bacterium]MBT7306834.1 response regulator [Gammaproteobacteria bacterium]